MRQVKLNSQQIDYLQMLLHEEMKEVSSATTGHIINQILYALGDYENKLSINDE